MSYIVHTAIYNDYLNGKKIILLKDVYNHQTMLLKRFLLNQAYFMLFISNLKINMIHIESNTLKKHMDVLLFYLQVIFLNIHL